MFGDVVKEVATVLQGEFLDEIKGEIQASAVKQAAALLFVAMKSANDHRVQDEGPKAGESINSMVERAADLALQIDAAVDHRLGIE